MMTNLDNKNVHISGDNFSMENLDITADALTQEILSELELESEADVDCDVVTIKLGHANSDLITEEEMNMEKVARLKRLIQCGEYRIDHSALAIAIMKSGDLDD